MDPHAYLGDPEREKEIHHLLDQIQVPDESLSDVSSDLILGRSTYEPESQVFIRGGNSPGRHHEDFFENSINSTIAHTSPLSNINLGEDSKLDSSLSQGFTPRQVSRMMDWSKNHITPAEGLFPQVSAPSMSIEGDIWESSPQDTPLPTMIMRSHSSVDKSQNHSKKSLHNLPVLDLPTHEEKPSREGITFSPNNAEAKHYFYNQNSKRSSANQSLKFPKNSFSSELMQGSALLAHAAGHHFPSEISLSQVRDNAPIFDEIHRLKSELANIKVAFRSERTMHEETKKELFSCSNALQEFEACRIELEQKNSELEEKIKLMTVKQKNPESLEQLRGKSLEHARIEIKQLKSYLSEKDKEIEDFKHALSQKNIMENNAARDKEIEELTYEITKLKIFANSQTKQIHELKNSLDREGKNKDNTTGELKSIIESYDEKLKKTQEKLLKTEKNLKDKNEDIEKLEKNCKELKQICENFAKEKNGNLDELNKAKETIEVLQKQVSGTYYDKASSADYDYQLTKLRNIYEKKLEDANTEISLLQQKSINNEIKIKKLEENMSNKLADSENSADAEATETILVMQEELKRLSTEIQDLSQKNSELKSKERNLIDKINSISIEKEEQEQEFLISRSQYNEEIEILEKKLSDYNRNYRIIEIETQNSKDLLKQYEEEMEKLRFAKKQAEQLSELLKRQLEDLKNNESTNKLKVREEVEQEMLKIKNSIQSLTAKHQFEKDEVYQKLREKDQEIQELKQELEESYNANEERVKTDVKYYKEKIEKEKDEEIKRIRKIYSNQNATQTSFDCSALKEEIKAQFETEFALKTAKIQLQTEEKVKKELFTELKEKAEQEVAAKYKQISNSEKENYDKRIEELSHDYVKKVENLKQEYSKTTSNIEQEFMNKVKSIENEYSQAMKKSKPENPSKTLELENIIKLKTDEIKNLQKKIKDHESQKSSLKSSYEDLDQMIKKSKDDQKMSFEREKQDLFEIFEKEKNELLRQKEKIFSELKKKEELLDLAKNNEKTLQQDFENKIEEIEKKYLSEINDYKTVYMNDVKDTERNFYLKEKRMEKEFNEKIADLNQEFAEKLRAEQEKYAEMMSKKDILSKADNQRVKEEVAGLVSEKEKEITEQFTKKNKLMKSQFEKEIKLKDYEIETLKEAWESEKRKIKEEFNEKINNLKQEQQRNKRESEKEQKKLKEMIENASETAKKDLELQTLENINKEKAEWDRKEKNKQKVLQSKHQKEMFDRENSLKTELEIEKNQALQELSETYKQKIKQIQEDQKKYYEELKQTALDEKAHEVELKVRRELQENYLKTISALDASHFQEKEKMREEYRIELNKRIEEIRRNEYNDESSYLDMPFFAKKNRSSNEDHSDLRNQLEIYKKRLENIEQERESEEFDLKKDYEKFKTEEYSRILSFIQEELGLFFVKPIPKPKNVFPEVSGLIRGFFNRVEMEVEILKEKIKQEVSLDLIKTGENKRKTVNFPKIDLEDSYFLRFADKLYISLDKSLDDLKKIHKIINEKQPFSYSDTFTSQNQKEEYFLIFSHLVRSISSSFDDFSSKYYNNDDKAKKYEQELKTLTQEYKSYVLKSKEWLETSNKKKEEWAAEKTKFEEKLEAQAEKIAKLQDFAPISPEMLSPEETTGLILGIFKRSNADSAVLQLLQQNNEFMSVIHYLIENESPKENQTYSIQHSDIHTSLNSARSYTRPKSVDVEIAPCFSRPPKHNMKFSSPISISQNFHPEVFTFPYDN